MNSNFEFVDRYGDCYPDPNTVCRGQCDGIGFVPVRADDMEEPWRTLWLKAHNAHCHDTPRQRRRRFCRGWREIFKHGIFGWWHICCDPCDGWHFVPCPDCGGTGKRSE